MVKLREFGSDLEVLDGLYDLTPATVVAVFNVFCLSTNELQSCLSPLRYYLFHCYAFSTCVVHYRRFPRLTRMTEQMYRICQVTWNGGSMENYKHTHTERRKLRERDKVEEASVWSFGKKIEEM